MATSRNSSRSSRGPMPAGARSDPDDPPLIPGGRAEPKAGAKAKPADRTAKAAGPDAVDGVAASKPGPRKRAAAPARRDAEPMREEAEPMRRDTEPMRRDGEPVRQEAAGEAPEGERLPDEQRQRRIAEAAYRKAQERGFSGDRQLDDWLEAEREHDGSDNRSR